MKQKQVTKQSKAGMVLQMTRGFRALLIISAAAMILAIIFNFLLPQVIRITVDSVIGEEAFNMPQFLVDWLDAVGGRDFLRQNLIVCAVAAMICSVLSGLTNYLSRISMAKASEGMVRHLRDRLYSHIQMLPYKWHVDNPTGDIIQRCTSDVEVIRNFLSAQLLEMLRTIVLLVIAFALMFPMNLKMSLLALAFIPVVLIYSSVFYSKISRKFKDADEAEGALSAMVQENFTGVRVVRAFGRQKYEINRFDKKNNFFARLWIKLGYLLAYYWGIGDFVSNLQVVSVLVLGVFETVSGNLTLGGFMAFIFYNSMLVWPVRSLGRILSEMSKTGVSLGRINEILTAEEEKDTEGAGEPDMSGDVVFDHVNFDYFGVNPVLKDIDFTIKAGTTIGILGGTGSGKSTLMYLLDRLYELPEDSGRITIGGVDIRNIKLEHLRKNIGFVLQEPFLFSKTIGENIGISGRSGDDLSAIRRSASIAAVDEAITEFSEGYDTVVGERGVTLSGGQKQRVAIARMLMQEAPIMVFDDSLSAVDAETDAKIRTALRKNTGSSTVILISHRITTLMHADQILVLENGKITQRGTHAELSAQEGIYQRICEIQGALEDELAGI